jgi:hypothetical protein
MLAFALAAPVTAYADDAPGSDDNTKAITTAADATGGWGNGPQTPQQVLAREFGVNGLTADMNSDEYFGALQARVGAYTALASGETRPHMSLQNIVTPGHLTFALSSDARWFLKVGAAHIESWADDNGTNLVDTSTTTSLVQLQFRPRAGTLIGFGPTYESNVIRAGQNRVTAIGAGWRFDLLQRMGNHLGFSAKVTWMDGITNAHVPLGEDLALVERQHTPRTYVQLGLVGMYNHQDFSLIPQGWSLRPTVHAIWQRTADSAATTNLGSFVASSHQDYSEVMATARLQKDEFRSGHIAPFVEAGDEIHVRSTIPTPATMPSLLYAKAGVTMRNGQWGFFDAYYSYHLAPDGTYRSGVLELLASLTF